MHEGLGWVFVFPQEDGIWMWHQEIGWIWTSAEVYPFLFRNRTNAWIFLHSNDGRSIIYDYGDGLWSIIK